LINWPDAEATAKAIIAIVKPDRRKSEVTTV
jgi:hypothetical protein